MKKIRSRITYANVMSSLAVFLVLGGATAFAATKIGSNEIKANAILTGKIKKEAVTAGKVKNAAITNSKLADGAVTESKIAAGAISPAKLSASAQPTLIASLQVKANGEVIASTPGVKVLKWTTGAYCVGLPFAAIGGAVSTRGDAGAESNAQVTVPGDPNCASKPGFTSAAVYTSDGGSLADVPWGGVFH